MAGENHPALHPQLTGQSLAGGQQVPLAGEQQGRPLRQPSSNSAEKGIAMFFNPTEKFGAGKQQKSRNRKFLGFLWPYIKSYRKYLFQILLALTSALPLR